MGKRRNILLENVEIIDIGAEGKGLGKHDGKVVFVPQAIPGDIINVRVTRKRNKYYEGNAESFVKYSDKRIEAFCQYFGTCGGCKWQHLPYPEQLKYKEKQVTDNLLRIGKIEIGECLPIVASEKTQFYRNKLEFAFSDTRWMTTEEIQSGEEIDRRGIGFHIPGKFDRIIDIETCYLQSELSNRIKNYIREYSKKNNLSFFNQRSQEGLLRTLMIRHTSIGEVMVLVIFTKDTKELTLPLLEALEKEFPEITCLQYIINAKMNDTFQDLVVKHFAGKEYITEKLENLEFRIGAKSFFQTNTQQALKLYELARDFASLTGNELVYDLYTGTGTIANFIAPFAKEVIGIEYVEDAIKDAVINSKNNRIENTKFYAGDMREILTESFINEHGIPDVLITDPPRAGMHEDVVECIKNAAPNRIVYVSCNPSTQARDIEILSDKYRVEKIQPVDMFPHTHHVENIALLTRI